MENLLPYYKTKLITVDYRERLSLIYQWVCGGHIDEIEFAELINFVVNLDLLPSED